MATPNQPLTLERLAALDEALPGRWFAEHGLGEEEAGRIGGTNPAVVQEAYDEDDEPCPVDICAACASDRVAAFIAATKGAAPRLLAALRALAERLRRRSEAASLNGESDRAEAYDTAIADLRHLLETLDLGAATPPRDAE